jgi:hypothetical protein
MSRSPEANPDATLVMENERIAAPGVSQIRVPLQENVHQRYTEGHNARRQKRPNQRVQEFDRRQHFDFNSACTAALAKSLTIEYRPRTT